MRTRILTGVTITAVLTIAAHAERVPTRAELEEARGGRVPMGDYVRVADPDHPFIEALRATSLYSDMAKSRLTPRFTSEPLGAYEITIREHAEVMTYVWDVKLVRVRDQKTVTSCEYRPYYPKSEAALPEAADEFDRKNARDFDRHTWEQNQIGNASCAYRIMLQWDWTPKDSHAGGGSSGDFDHARWERVRHFEALHWRNKLRMMRGSK